MDEYSDYNPQYCIEGVTFRFYSSDEIKALSVKEIKNPETFDSLSQPNIGGLYDPALGKIFSFYFTCLQYPKLLKELTLLQYLKPIIFHMFQMEN